MERNGNTFALTPAEQRVFGVETVNLAGLDVFYKSAVLLAHAQMGKAQEANRSPIRADQGEARAHFANAAVAGSVAAQCAGVLGIDYSVDAAVEAFGQQLQDFRIITE